MFIALSVWLSVPFRVICVWCFRKEQDVSSPFSKCPDHAISLFTCRCLIAPCRNLSVRLVFPCLESVRLKNISRMQAKDPPHYTHLLCCICEKSIACDKLKLLNVRRLLLVIRLADGCILPSNWTVVVVQWTMVNYGNYS